ncbi:uncharacterized protein LOC143563503 [Bidens hawaiensis]|uniref:uncharacterized protein LOC143563503 n=1 Tax=Bidens hawaiensis TaxID=980011 RepID=UPI00404B3D68
MSYYALLEYIKLVKQVESYRDIMPETLIHSLKSYTMLVYQSDLQNEFSKPMPWIGMYIALASLFCILAMTRDLLHGFRNKNLWFPCKYFTLNAASLTLIAVAMKLPVDLNNSMPGYVDQTAKLGSLAFMCTLMANSLPSLATMDHKELLTNVIALGFLVITICVNVCIQINTGVLSYYMDDEYSLENISDAKDLSSHTHLCDRSFIAIIHLKKVVVACKMIALIPVFFVICVLWLQTIFGLVFRHAQQDTSTNIIDLHNREGVELADTTVKKILNFVDSVIKKAEKQQPCNLMKLLERSRGFEGVEFFNRHHVPPLLTEEPISCWSLNVITFTSIVRSLPNIENDKVGTLLSSVSEGLVYVTLVEESLNATSEYISIQKAEKMLRLEVEVYRRWLGNKMLNHVPHLHTTRQILEWFRDTAKNMVIKTESKDTENQNDNSDNSICKSICANSMYFVTQKLLLSYRSNIEPISQEELFEQLSSLIADTLAACLTNLPRVIAMKCNKNAIEEREAGIHAAARLLGETKQIIDNLQDRELPSLNLDELPFIDKWHAYYNL